MVTSIRNGVPLWNVTPPGQRTSQPPTPLQPPAEPKAGPVQTKAEHQVGEELEDKVETPPVQHQQPRRHPPQHHHRRSS